MSIGILGKQVSYDNPCAPIVKFDDDDDENDMLDEQLNNIEHSLKAYSLEDLVKSFDNTINSCFIDQELIESNEYDSHLNLVDRSKTWSNLIENLRTSLRHDLKLPNVSSKQEMNFHDDNDDFISIDDLNEDEEEDLREKLDMHAILFPTTINQPFLTAEQVISEIDFMLKDLTPDSGFGGDDIQQSYFEFDLKTQSTSSLNQLIDELNQSIQDLSSILVQELANRDDFEEEKETKNTFIELVVQIQNKRRSITTKTQSNTV